MSPLLKTRPQIRQLAADLGLGSPKDAVRAILEFCERQVRAVLKEFPHCSSPPQLLEALANKLRTRFEVVTSDTELRQLQKRYAGQGEKGFARLEEELSPDVYGITLRRMQRELWEPDFVSVIDCRGDKVHRQNHTKWHEVGHLLILTSEARVAFRRTHCVEAEMKPPEESLVDVIAGTFAFLPEMVQAHVTGEVSFELIEDIRAKLCPEASRQSALIGIVKAWPTPCLLVHAQLALRKQERQGLRQGAFGFDVPPAAVLRAVHVTPSEAARKEGFSIFPNMRVPERSVIHRIFGDCGGHLEAIENLSWWEASDGTKLSAAKVLVKARYAWDSVDALVAPVAA